MNQPPLQKLKLNQLNFGKGRNQRKLRTLRTFLILKVQVVPQAPEMLYQQLTPQALETLHQQLMPPRQHAELNEVMLEPNML